MCDPLAGVGGRDTWLAHNKGAALKQPVYGGEPYLAPRPSFPISGAWQHTVARSPHEGATRSNQVAGQGNPAEWITCSHMIRSEVARGLQFPQADDCAEFGELSCTLKKTFRCLTSACRRLFCLWFGPTNWSGACRTLSTRKYRLPAPSRRRAYVLFSDNALPSEPGAAPHVE
jgi:hypothetical protein